MCVCFFSELNSTQGTRHQLSFSVMILKCRFTLEQLPDIQLETWSIPYLGGTKVCTVQPLGVSENATFIVDVETVNYEDLKADDLGSWHPTGTKRAYFRFSSDETLRVSEKCPRNMPSEYYVLTRRYYTHKSYNKFQGES